MSVYARGTKQQGMLLRTRLLQLVGDLRLDSFATRRVEAALRTVEHVLGPLELVDILAEPELAQKVTLRGDDATYIVTGEWSDGTFDLMREQGSFSDDVLCGWRPGQSIAAFRAELQLETTPVEPAVEEPAYGKRNVYPLRRNAASPPRARG